MKDLSKIKFWLFDLDNTLYDGATKVFDQVDKKMSKFISEKLNVSLEEARKIQNCVDAVENGVRGVVILDGRKPHSILHEIFSDKGSGTLIRE